MALRCLCLLLIVGCNSTGDTTGLGECEIPAAGCECDPQIDTEVSCFEGEGSLVGVGACEKGLRSCNADTGQWGDCVGQRLASSEDCDSVDNDCDGSIDEGVADCQQLIRYPGPCTMSADVGVDGTIENTWLYGYDANHLLVEQTFDAGNDGTTDVRYTFSRDGENRVILRQQFDGMGTLTGLLDYIYQDTPSRLIQLMYKDAAGTPNRKVDYFYTAGLNDRQDHDIGLDGTLDERWFYYYDSSNVLIRAERERMVGIVDFTLDYAYDEALNPVLYVYDTNGDGTIDEQRTPEYSCWDGILTP